MADAPPPPADVPKCIKCKTAPGVYTVRTEPNCRSCYLHYIHTKPLKRLVSYRTRASTPPTYLLPLSLGVSSTTLLHLTSHYLDTQRRKSTRVHYHLLPLFISEQTLDPSAPAPAALAALQHRYPAAASEWLVLPLEHIYEFPGAVAEAGVDAAAAEDTGDAAARLRRLFASLPSPSSRMDLLGILRTRLIAEVARARGCEAVLWGDTTTKLAEKTLAATAKGRGFSLPWMMRDGEAGYGVKFYYPLRDLFKKEVVTFAGEILEEPFIGLCAGYSAQPRHSAAAATSGRNITVDELMTQYFEQMEQTYPSIVNNVVRTADRLTVVDKEAERCRICGLPGDGGASGLTLGELPGDEEDSGLCYGCMRAAYGAGELEWPIKS